MSFDDYLSCDEIIDLESEEKSEALEELASILAENAQIRSPKKLVSEMMSREENSSTFVGQGVAIPQSEASIKDDFLVIVGRSAQGVNYDAARNAKAYIIVLVVTNGKVTDDEDLELRAEISSFFKNETVNKLIRSAEVDQVSEAIREVSKDSSDDDGGKKIKKDPVLSTAISLAREVNAKALMVYADAKTDNEFLKALKTMRRQVFLVASNKTRFKEESGKFEVIQAPAVRGGIGIGQVKIGVLLAMSRGFLQKNDDVVCVTGNADTDAFDTVVLVDIAREFDFFFTKTRSLVPEDVKPEILERVLGVASEISIEGREGKSMGTIFVVGDTNRVNAHITQLIINPFRGYSEAEKNIMDPGLEETLKEFASIDGAFVVTGDGVVLSAGSYLRPMLAEEDLPVLPPGLGTRHAAAAGITACTNAIAITVSESTGQVTVFKNGAIALTLTKPLSK